MHTRHWPVETGIFLLWGLTSTVGMLAVLGILTIGIFVLPFAWLLLGGTLWLTVRRPGREGTVFGALLGPAAWSSYIGAAWAARSHAADGSLSGLDLRHFMPFAGVTVGCTTAAVALFAVVQSHIHRRRAASSGAK